MPARPPLLETVEAVEAPQLPGRMALQQRAKDAAFPSRSRGERAAQHGRGVIEQVYFSFTEPRIL